MSNLNSLKKAGEAIYDRSIAMPISKIYQVTAPHFTKSREREAKGRILSLSNFRNDRDVVQCGYTRSTLPNVFYWLRAWDKETFLKIAGLGVHTDDLYNPREQAYKDGQEYAVEAISANSNYDVVNFGAMTKRLFSKKALAELRQKFPETIFTIGDSYTVQILKEDVLRELSNIKGRANSDVNVLVTGASGFLGEQSVSFLVEAGYNVIGLCTDTERAAKIAKTYSVSTTTDKSKISNIDAIVACTHAYESRLTMEFLRKITRNKTVMRVIDPAEPSAFSRKEYAKCKGNVVRIDAGNAHSQNLEKFGEVIIGKALGLPKRQIWACFAEAMILARHKDDERVRAMNWMKVSPESLSLIAELAEGVFSQPPVPSSFGEERRGARYKTPFTPYRPMRPAQT